MSLPFADLLPACVAVREADPRDYPADLSGLFPEEAVLVERAVEKRRREYAAGRFLAREAAAILGVDDLVLVNDERRAPIWPEGIVGSITHTRTWCAAAVARSSELRAVGIDVEQDTPLKPNLWDTVCTRKELAWLADQRESERGWLGKALFSAKEAAYKAQYLLTQQFLGFHAMSVEIDPHAGVWRATFERPSGDLFGVGDALGGRLRRGRGLIATAVVIA